MKFANQRKQNKGNEKGVTSFLTSRTNIFKYRYTYVIVSITFFGVHAKVLFHKFSLFVKYLWKLPKDTLLGYLLVQVFCTNTIFGIDGG